MPWRETRVLEERLRFVQDYESMEWTMKDLCQGYGISRKTGYKYLARYGAHGLGGLRDLSRAPHNQPNRVGREQETRIVQLRRQYPRWGARKLGSWLRRNEPNTPWPSPSTIHEVLRRSGVVKPRKRRNRACPSRMPLAEPTGPNSIWCVDFKGWFLTGNRSRCDPFTATDACSRYALICKLLQRTDFETVQIVLKCLFREYGMPDAIRSDNGPPFAARGLAGLCRFAVWLVLLDIRIQRIEPGHPEQNGSHERFHLTLKQETASPPRRTLRAQQRAFNRFRKEFNEERPHQALDGQTPSDLYKPSPRPFPRRLTPPEYPSDYVVRKVASNGSFKLSGMRYFVSEALSSFPVGLKQLSERRWVVSFGPLEIGVLDSEAKVIFPHSQLTYRGMKASV